MLSSESGLWRFAQRGIKELYTVTDRRDQNLRKLYYVTMFYGIIMLDYLIRYGITSSRNRYEPFPLEMLLELYSQAMSI